MQGMETWDYIDFVEDIDSMTQESFSCSWYSWAWM